MVHKHPHELFSADDSVVVLVDITKNLLDAFDGFFRIFQEKGDFLKGYWAWMVDVEVAESLLEVLPGKEVSDFQSSHYKLS